MSNSILTVAILGTFQNGKSTLINCIASSNVAIVGGMGLSVTHTIVRYKYGSSNNVTIIGDDDKSTIIPIAQYIKEGSPEFVKEVIIELSCPYLKYVEIVDTPGFNANDHDTYLAEQLLNQVDLGILLLRNKGISEEEKKIASQLRDYNIPFTCVVNCFDDILDNWNPHTEQNDYIKQSILAELYNIGCKPINKNKIKPIYVLNLMWYWLALENYNENKAISLCNRKIHKFWDELIGDCDFSPTKLKRASAVQPFFGIFKNQKDLKYFFALKLVKSSHSQCVDILKGSIGDLRNGKSTLISSLISHVKEDIQNEQDQITKKLQNYKEREKKYEGLNLFSWKGIFNYLLNLPLEGKESEYKHRLSFLETKKEILLSFINSLK